MDANRMIETLYRNCESGTLNIRIQQIPSKKTFNEFIGIQETNTDRELEKIINQNQSANIWYAVALRNGQKGGKDGIFAIPALWVDIDHFDEEIERKLRAFLKPTIHIQTSLGTKRQLLWRLKEPGSYEDIIVVENLNRRLVKYFSGDPNSWEAAKVLRLVGTFNFKYTPPLPVKLLEINEDTEYNLNDFDQILPVDEQGDYTREERKECESENLQRIMACRFLQHCDNERSILSEPHWYAMVGILARESGGRDLIHSLSKGYPGYSPQETDKKILHAINDAGPATCVWIKNLWDCGRDCGVKSPAALGYKEQTAKTDAKNLSYLNLNLPSSLEISRLQIKVDWVVKNLIPKESITLLHSIGGVGKSYLMYQLAKVVADEEPFFGLGVMKMPVYYIDHENPLPEIADRMKKIGGSENLKIWHLGHDPMPVRFDADEWEIYKTFPPGLFIIDSLRSSYMDEENSSKVASFIMARLKEIRALGFTIILIHHENKLGGYRGSTAWFDLSDHILKFSRVRKVGSDEDVEEDDFDLPIRLGLGGKSRFSSAMEMKPIYFRFENHQLCRSDDPEEEILRKMAELLNPLTPPNQSEFQKLAKQNIGIGQKDFRRLLKKGEDRNLWFVRRSTTGNKLEYFKVVK